MRCTLALLFLTVGVLGIASETPCPARNADRPLELTILRGVGSERGGCGLLGQRRTQKVRGLGRDSVYTSRVQTARPGEERVRLIAYDKEALWNAARNLCGDGFGVSWADSEPQHTDQAVLVPPALDRPSGNAPPLQVEPLIQTGPSSNRVDLVFFSDGYLAEEHDKFLADARRLAEDVSQNQTFNTVKPLLNFWAAFTPSRESGIGAGGKPKDTPFGLYRPGTELRGVYYSKPEVGRAACDSLGDRCDYPILMGNDPLYGGLGGEFTVITPSLANGPLVLRHELGHSIIEVGEEYDGGYGYFGVNAAQNSTTPVSWAHWLTSTSDDASTHVERAVMPMQDYAWTMLNTTTAWSVNFSASGTYDRHLVRFSLSALPEASDLSVELDGEDLGWVPRPGIGEDRWHYDIHTDGGLSDGLHELKFTLKNPEREGVAQLCSAEILEFGDATQFNATPGHYSLYPTFFLNNAMTFRPTNEDCLMRQVPTPNFCKVCREGLWMSLLRRVDLIDHAAVSCHHDFGTKKSKTTIDLKLVPLGQFREGSILLGEGYTITWAKNGQILDEFTNKTHLEGSTDPATYTVDVKFATEEVRVDKDGLLTSRKEITTHRCAL